MFKERFSFEARKKHADMVLRKYPDRVPVIIEGVEENQKTGLAQNQKTSQPQPVIQKTSIWSYFFSSSLPENIEKLEKAILPAVLPAVLPEPDLASPDLGTDVPEVTNLPTILDQTGTETSDNKELKVPKGRQKKIKKSREKNKKADKELKKPVLLLSETNEKSLKVGFEGGAPEEIGPELSLHTENCENRENPVLTSDTPLPTQTDNNKPNTASVSPRIKYLVPGHYTVGQFFYLFRKTLHLKPEEACFLYVGNTLVPLAQGISQVYQEYRDKDGLLYMRYATEHTFGK